MPPRLLRRPHAHDTTRLIRRWRRVAKTAGLTMSAYAETGGTEVFFLEGTAPAPAPTLYLSAGIHGDEPAATEGLIAWAEKNTARLRRGNFLIFPCLNPWGLLNNSRFDAEGRDLNRGFHDDSIPQIAAHLRLLGSRRFDLALTLHEDYDAPGFYLYEIPGRRPHWGEHLVRAAARHLPVDTRRTIEGRKARNGIVRRSINPDLMPTWPEAFVLHFTHCSRVFTVETPSEFHLDDRVAAHISVLTTALHLCMDEFRHAKRRRF